MAASHALFWLRLLHTAIWAVMAGAILALPVLAVKGWFDAALAVTLLVAVEGVALGLAGGPCPLTAVAARYTDDRGPAFDIFLPEVLARWNKEVFTTLFVAGEAFVVVLLFRSGDGVSAWRHLAALGIGGAAVALAFLTFDLRRLGSLGIPMTHPRVLRQVLLTSCLGAAGLSAVWVSVGISTP